MNFKVYPVGYYFQQVTIVSNHPPQDDNPAITYIRHGLPHFREDKMNLFEESKKPDNMFGTFRRIFPLMARDIYDVPEVKDLYERRSEFDVFIIDQIFNEVSGVFLSETGLSSALTFQ